MTRPTGARERAGGRFAGRMGAGKQGFTGRAVFLLALATAMACGAAEYRHPSGLPAKSLKTEVKEEPLMRVGAERHMRVLRVEVPDKQIKDTRPLEDVKLHVRQTDGSDLQLAASVGMSYGYSGGGWALKLATNVVLSWTPSFPGAQAGDVYPCYISFETGAKKWATREFSLKIGGSGQHMRCDKCFSIGMAPKTTLATTTAARMGALGATNAAAGRGMAGRGDGGGASGPPPGVRVQDLLDGKEIRGRDILLENDILIYSLDALPREEGMGQLRAGLTVHVFKEAAPSFVHVKFTTSNGRTYEGAAKIADLVSQRDLSVDVSTPRMDMSPDPHQNEWKLRNLPFSLVASGTAAETVHLRCVRPDGTEQDLSIQGSSSSSTEYVYVRGLLTLGAQPGDEYLCYAVYNDGRTTWTSQAFGLACGTGTHSGCEDCFSFVSQKDVAAMMETILAAKKAGWEKPGAPGSSAVPGPGAAGAAGIRPGKVVLARDTPIYDLRRLPQEQMLGTLRAGAALYVMEDMGGAYVRVRFTTPAGRSGEGVAKKADLAPSAR